MQGLVLTTSFYWAQSPKTRGWTERYVKRIATPPTEYNAAAYASVMHWLKAVTSVGSLDGDAVAQAMHETPVNDFYNDNVRILPNGSVPHTMYLWEVKKPEDSKAPWDYAKLVKTIPADEAWRPLDQGGCSLVKK